MCSQSTAISQLAAQHVANGPSISEQPFET
jgi:hypothetical protein